MFSPSNALQVLGLLPVGYFCFFAIKTIPYYIKNKQWPRHPAELEREKEQEVHAIAKSALEAKNTMLLDRIGELEEDIANIWKKTLARLSEK